MGAETIEIGTAEGIAIVSLTGNVDVQSSPKMRRALLRCLAEGRHVLVDLDGVTSLDSSGVASLVEAFQNARKNGMRFALAGVNAAALRALRLTRLDRVFAIHPSVEAALKAGV